MYKTYLITAITILFLTHTFFIFGQTETQGKRKSSKVEIFETPTSKNELPRNAHVSNKFKSDLIEKFLLDDIDTLNYPLEGTEALYVFMMVVMFVETMNMAIKPKSIILKWSRMVS